MNVFRQCPSFYGPKYTLRQVRMEDAEELLHVYGAPGMAGWFNDDLCTTDFLLRTVEEMRDCIAGWLSAWKAGWYVRWTVLDEETERRPVGTVEMCLRRSEDAFDGCGILRLDLNRTYEHKDAVYELVRTMLPEMYRLFGCRAIITKAPPHMMGRRLGLAVHGFIPSKEVLRGPDGRTYGDYWIRRA